MQAKIGKLVRQKRPAGKNGESRDTARCTVTTADGQKKIHYLGRWGSQEALQEYARLQYLTVSGEYSLPEVDNSPDLTLENIYLEYLEKFNGSEKSSDIYRVKTTIRYAMEAVPDITVGEFGLQTFAKIKSYFCSIASDERKEFRIYKGLKQRIATKKKWSLGYVNKLLSTWKRIIHYGINAGYIKPEIWTAIKDSPLVKESDLNSPPSLPAREAVDDKTINYTLPILPPTVARFVRFLRGTGARPSELCRIQIKDLQRIDDGLYLFAPDKHKTAAKNKKRYIVFSRSESAEIEKIIVNKEPDDFLFSPKDLIQEKWDRLSRERKSKVQPSQVARTKKKRARKLSRFHEGFTSASIGRALKNAIERFNKSAPADKQIPRWTLYQVRHAAYTANSEQFGIETASKIAGHSSPEMARVYDHSAKQAAIQAAEQRK